MFPVFLHIHKSMCYYTLRSVCVDTESGLYMFCSYYFLVCLYVEVHGNILSSFVINIVSIIGLSSLVVLLLWGNLGKFKNMQSSSPF